MSMLKLQIKGAEIIKARGLEPLTLAVTPLGRGLYTLTIVGGCGQPITDISTLKFQKVGADDVGILVGILEKFLDQKDGDLKKYMEMRKEYKVLTENFAELKQPVTPTMSCEYVTSYLNSKTSYTTLCIKVLAVGGAYKLRAVFDKPSAVWRLSSYDLPLDELQAICNDADYKKFVKEAEAWFEHHQRIKDLDHNLYTLKRTFQKCDF